MCCLEFIELISRRWLAYHGWQRGEKQLGPLTIKVIPNHIQGLKRFEGVGFCELSDFTNFIHKNINIKILHGKNVAEWRFRDFQFFTTLPKVLFNGRLSAFFCGAKFVKNKRRESYYSHHSLTYFFLQLQN